jgi:two-component system CheB/CheR fusion protein
MPLPVILSPRKLPVEWPAEPPASPRAESERLALHRHMLEKVAPPSMLIDENHHAIHLSDGAGRYLKFSGGSITTDATELVREELRFNLRMGLHRAFGRGETTLSAPIPVQFNGESRRIYVQVKPALEENDPTHYALVLFIEGETVEPKESAAEEGEPAAQVTDSIKQLQDELQLAHGQLRATREDSEAANEELRAANEELQSINEEYRSTSEELETSKEELQSINEELQTVNNELKLKLESVSRTNSDLQNLMAASDFGTLFLDTALRIKRFTPKLTELFNVTPNDEGRPITDFTHQLEYDGLAIHARAVLKDLVPVEHEVKGHDGRWYLVRVRPYRTVDDKIDGVVATFVDITVRRRTEEALRASEERFRALVMASSQVIYSMSPDWKEMRQLHGRGFLADLGNASHKWLEKYILVEDQPRFVAAMSEAIRTKSIFELEHRVRRADGSVGWITSRAAPILNEDGQIVEWFGAATDITYRKSSEEALIRTDRLKDEFLATLAHELRNPLAPIHNATHVLKKRHGAGDPDAPLLDIIQRQVEHLVRLVSELTEVSRISRGKIDLRKEGVDVASVVRDAVETSKPLVEKKGHRVTTSLPKEPLWVFGDRMRLVQVVSNLINNAAKYTAANGAIDIKASRENHEAVLRVRDNGIGVSADMLSHVFELFTQIGSSADNSEGGLGIGLALARKLVELHGGRITAHSEGTGRGSEFVVRLPLCDKPPASSETTEPATEDDYNSVRVLVVDDQREVGNSMVGQPRSGSARRL